MAKFKFMGTNIFVTEERDRYNKISLQYKILAENAQKQFITMYKENNNLDDVINNSYDQGISIILDVIKFTVDKLVENKFYNIDEEVFIEKYCQDAILEWEEAFNIINDKYMNIVLDEQQKENYRKLRKDARGRWQGGGFGVQGAIKGAVQAGAMNAVTGVAHSTFNMVGKIGSSIKANNQKSTIFNDPLTLRTLAEGINLSIWNIHYSYAKFLEENTDLRFEYVYSNESKEADIIFKNLKERNIEIKDKVELLKKIIELNPYKESIYVYILNNFGDKDREISQIANYFGFNMDYYKMELIKSKLQGLNTDTEMQTISAKKVILDQIERLGIQGKLNIIEELDKKLGKFDVHARTVDDILFKTRQEADLAQNEKTKIQSILNNTNMNIEKNVVEARNAIINLNLKTVLMNSYINNIDKKLEEFDIQARTVENMLFRTREEAAKIRENKYKIEKIISEMDELNEDSLLKAKESVLKIGTKLESSKKYIENIDKRLEEIDIQARTVGDILFKTREEAILAREDKNILDKIVSKIDEENEESIKTARKEIELNEFNTILAKNEIRRLDNKLEKIDIQARTVGNMLFKTREEANLARADKIQIDRILSSSDRTNEKSLIKTRKKIESKSFKTKIVEIYLADIEKSLQDIYSETIKEADEYEENKENFRGSIIASLITFPVGIYFFDRVGTLLKIVIGVCLLSVIASTIVENNKLRKSKKAMRKVNKLKKHAKI